MSHHITPANSEARAVELYRCPECDAELDHPYAPCDECSPRYLRPAARLNDAVTLVAQLASSAMDDVVPDEDGNYTLDAEDAQALLDAIAAWNVAGNDFMASL